MAHVAPYKKEVVKKIVKLLVDYPIVGAVNMENLPASQLQTMRSKLRKDVEMIMTKRRLIKIALKEASQKRPGVEKLEQYLYGMPALLFTKGNPFALSKTLAQNKSPAPAKGGQTAPNDIVIPAGPTPFAPGPVIGEFGAIGVKAGVENGKVAVKADTVVAKMGEKIRPKVAELLTRLGIEPMEVGLDLTAAFENGIIYTKDILSIDDKEYMGRLNNASRWSFNLAMFISYPSKTTMPHLIGKAFNESKALGRGVGIFEKEVMPDLIGQAHRGMLGLKQATNL
jgi:large subunit ribosomal protein L10